MASIAHEVTTLSGPAHHALPRREIWKVIGASSAGSVSPRTQRRFDQHVDKALASIEEAMGHIVAAGVAADSDGGQ